MQSPSSSNTVTIPNPNAGPPFTTVASEVATMDFARTVLDKPIPKILLWSGDGQNPVESEYILMEEAKGKKLSKIWYDLDLFAKLRIVDEVVAIEKKLLPISFTRYGSLYFNSDMFPSCEKVELVGDVSQSLKQEVQERFVVGPVVDRDFYHAERATMSLDRGPWKTPLAYLRSIANREIAWLTHHAPGKPSADESDAQSTPSAHIDLYNRFLKVADHLLPAGELSKPTLWHPYLHTPNLFVTGDRITSVVDWQHACIRPLFLQSRRAPLVRYWGEKMLQLPDDFDTMADEAEQARVMDGVDSSIILQHYERATEAKNPTLHRVDQVPQRVERRATVASAGNTWDEDIVRLRQGLIRVARQWDDITATLPCPISFSDQEITANIEVGVFWNDAADFWDRVDREGYVYRDGWCPIHRYEDADNFFGEVTKMS